MTGTMAHAAPVFSCCPLKKRRGVLEKDRIKNTLRKEEKTQLPQNNEWKPIYMCVSPCLLLRQWERTNKQVGEVRPPLRGAKDAQDARGAPAAWIDDLARVLLPGSVDVLGPVALHIGHAVADRAAAGGRRGMDVGGRWGFHVAGELGHTGLDAGHARLDGWKQVSLC